MPSKTETHTTSLSALDHLPPPTYANAILYVPLKANTDAKQVFDVLREGLHRTFIQLPWLSGRVFSPAPGHYEIRSQPVLAEGPRPEQLKFKQLDSSETIDDFRESAFHPESFEDEVLTWKPFLCPPGNEGTEVFIAQANFLQDCVVITAATSHVATDGVGLIHVIKIWSDNCKDAQRGSAMPAALPQGISDRNIFQQNFSNIEGVTQSVEDILPKRWNLLGIDTPEATQSNTPMDSKAAEETGSTAKPSDTMKSCVFYTSPAQLTTLVQDCKKELGGSDISINDAICALAWRSLLKARAAAKAQSISAISSSNLGEQSRLDLPFDVRSYFPESIPGNYLGNCTMINRITMALEELVAPSTTVGGVARQIRSVANEVTLAGLLEAYTLAKSVPGEKPGTDLSYLRLDGNALIITSLVAFPLNEVCFGDGVFGNGGHPESLRTMMGAINKIFRYCAVLPRKEHGGVEFVANLSEKEIDVLMEDEEFSSYAMFVA